MTKQRKTETPKLRLNGKHQVTIRLGAMHDSVTVDGHTLDLSNRPKEDLKGNMQRRQRVINDLNSLIFS